ncbi:hypothetical protein Syun_021759 [Stephania yunnanensis]|uniref:Uncharacterized protein n=1 Tax=Stephania yunnanensis TaxID=152371 RepID=A0AAP0II47_9MAGN
MPSPFIELLRTSLIWTMLAKLKQSSHTKYYTHMERAGVLRHEALVFELYKMEQAIAWGRLKSCATLGKACRENMRRDKLNDRLWPQELMSGRSNVKVFFASLPTTMRSPDRFEVVDDRYRNGRKSDESRSLNHEKDLDTTSPPMVRPVRDILGDDAPPLRISRPPKPNDGKVADGTAKTQAKICQIFVLARFLGNQCVGLGGQSGAHVLPMA